jgi:hypothetical protein
MDFEAKLSGLQQRVEDVKSSVNQAATESHEQLVQRIDNAHADADRDFDTAKAHVTAAAGEAQRSWEQMRTDARAKAAEIKAKAERRADEVDASLAASDAEWADADAAAAVDYANWAVENARLAILDAIDARAYADERAAALT